MCCACPHRHLHTRVHDPSSEQKHCLLPAYVVPLNVPSGERELSTRVSNLAFGTWISFLDNNLQLSKDGGTW